jgi:hypothetical protein
MHIGRVQLFRSSIADVILCLEVENVDVELITIIEDYLLLQGCDNMVNKTPFGSKYLPLARIIDELGWDCFLEGRIPITLLEAVGLSLPSRRSIAKWGISFIKTLLSVTHRQWLFQNADVHHDFDGLTMHGHKLLFIRINELLTTPPEISSQLTGIYFSRTSSNLGTPIRYSGKYGSLLWSQLLVLPPISIQDILPQGASTSSSQPGNVPLNQKEVQLRHNTPNANTSSAHDALTSEHYRHLFGYHSKQAKLKRFPPTRI